MAARTPPLAVAAIAAHLEDAERRLLALDASDVDYRLIDAEARGLARALAELVGGDPDQLRADAAARVAPKVERCLDGVALARRALATVTPR